MALSIRQHISIFVLGTAFLFFTSCGKSDKNVLVITDDIKIDIKTDQERLSTSVIGSLLFSPLLYIHNDSPHYVLAEEVKVLPGNRVIEVKLRDGVRFHSGREVTTDDIAYAVEKLKLSDSSFKGVNIEVLDRLRFRLVNNIAVPDINSLLTEIIALPPEFSEIVDGTGAFRFEKWLENGLELAANEDYFEGRPKIDRIVYLFEDDERKRISQLLKGEADILFFVPPEWARFLLKDERFYVTSHAGASESLLYFNNKSHFFKDKSVRMAASLGIDRDSLVEKGINGAGIKASGPFFPGILSSYTGAKSLSVYAPKKAAVLLRDAGWRDADGDGLLEKDGKKLVLNLYYCKISEMKKLVDSIAKNLYELGIGVKDVGVTFDEFRKNHYRSGDYDAFMDITYTGDGYLYHNWHSLSQASPEGSNFSGFSNKDMDVLLDKLSVTSNIDDKNEIYAKMQQIFEDEVPAAFLYHSLIFSAANRRFKGAEDLFPEVYYVYKIKDWSVNDK